MQQPLLASSLQRTVQIDTIVLQTLTRRAPDSTLQGPLARFTGSCPFQTAWTSTSCWCWVLVDSSVLIIFFTLLCDCCHDRHALSCYLCSLSTSVPQRRHWVDFPLALMLPMNRRTDFPSVLIHCCYPFDLVFVFFFALYVVSEGKACNRWFPVASFIVCWHYIPNKTNPALIVELSTLTCLLVTQQMKQFIFCMLNHFAHAGLKRHYFSIWCRGAASMAFPCVVV